MTLFRCERLTKNLGEYKLKDVSFSLEPGRVLGVIGTNGCGKTTLLRTILGSYRLDREGDFGELEINKLHFRRDVKAYKESMAYVLQSTPFSEFMHPVEIGERYGHFYPGFDLKKYKELLGEYKVPVKEMISLLSKGQALRMQLAFALSYPAKLYVFDEPVGNLDVEFRDTFYGIVRELTASEQCSVILSSHLVTELEHVADEILWIGKENEEGFVRFTGTMDDLKNRYRLLSVDDETAKAIPAEMIRGKRLRENHKDYLIYQEDGDFTKEGPGALPKELWEELRFPDLQEIMYFVEKRDE